MLAEGTQGHLTGAAIRHFDLGSEDPQQWELGVKEVWEVEKPLDRVIHTMGWPLALRAKYREFGGSFIYPMGEDKVSMGFVVGLDYRDATSRSTTLLQELKATRSCREDHRGRQARRLGRQDDPLRRLLGDAKRELWAPGMAIAGDGAGMVNIPTLKGVHYAMHAGMFAAEAIYERLKAGGDCDDLSSYQAQGRGLGDREGHLPLAQHAPAVREGLLRRRRWRT